VTLASLIKRDHLARFVRRRLEPHADVQAVLAVGSVAAGTAHPGSDIDAVLFLSPMNRSIVPREFIWREADDTCHSIFVDDQDLQESGIQFDFKCLDWERWKRPAHEWPEPIRAEWGSAVVMFDRVGRVKEALRERTCYDDGVRQSRLDEAILWLDQHLDGDGPRRRWETLGPVVAHDRLQAAYDHLAQALFAVNRRWRPWRNREMTALLQMPWLPEDFAQRVLTALCPPSQDYPGYRARAERLREMFAEVLEKLIAEGAYGERAIEEAFKRHVAADELREALETASIAAVSPSRTPTKQ
jgi:hypothetical protein